MATLAAWNDSILDVVLPAAVNAGQPVLFACDDETTRLAGARLGLSGAAARSDLLSACRHGWEMTAQTGIRGLAQGMQRFRKANRPRATPPWLAALALSVMAASEMNRDSRRVTQDYYGRLLELVDLPSARAHPPLVGFELLESLWSEFADWLAAEQTGSRGLLHLPENLTQRHVGIPISQTMFRRRDRVLLGRFLLRHQANIEAGWDILRLLRIWGARHELTQHARDVIADDAVGRLVRSALRAAYASWDGSLEDDSGRRSWPALLRLAASPRRIGLYVSCEHYSVGGVFEGPYGSVELPAFPRELEVPLAWLDDLAATRLLLVSGDGDEAVALPSGETLLFEARNEGLMHVHSAGNEPVWLLTREPVFHSPEYDDHRYTAGLVPESWTLLAAVEPNRLPATLREGERNDRADVALVGGLRLGEDVYLEGFPPQLASGDLPQPLEVIVNGRPFASLGSFGRVSLESLGVGAHVVDVGLTQFSIELATRGRRDNIGNLRWDLGDPPLYRNGAGSVRRGGRVAVGPFVRGPELAGVERPACQRQVLMRTNAPVFVIYADGKVGGCSRPQPQGWQRQVGLLDGAHRWPLPESERAQWAAVASRAPHVVRVGRGPVALTAHVAEIAVRFRESPVIGSVCSTSEATAEWHALCCACGEAHDAD
jgi:hypothetical protein